jgi:chloramphenicol 3-O phosphotransferase
MLPEAMIGHPDGVVFAPVTDPGGPSIAIAGGAVMNRAMRGMRRAIAAMAAAGNDLIVDDVMLGRGEAEEYRALLRDCELRFVGLFAPLAVLEARERARGDRRIGLARWQYARVHSGIVYDLEIDTSAASPQDCAQTIKAQFAL